MELNKLYKVDADILPKNLKSYYNKVRLEDRHKVLNSYIHNIMEGRPGPGLFWIVPDKDRVHNLMLFAEYYQKYDDHETLWREVVSGIVLNHFGIVNEEFKDLFDASPRGRLEIGEEIGKWLIGFGGDYPEGWNEDKLLERLRVLRKDARIEYDADHWKANDENHQIAMNILYKK